MKLSDLKCRKAKAEEKLLKLSDGDGLFHDRAASGLKPWTTYFKQHNQKNLSTPR